MALTSSELFARILEFPIDEGTPELTFEARLARENGWSLGYALRVVKEYRRFVMLAITTGHMVTPSDQVDQAWHLHLTYTRSYWERFCGQVLERPLHHGPTRGGEVESAKFHDHYQRTLTAYQNVFAEEPPADIWPPVAERFGEDLHYVRINTARNWVVPKSRLRLAAFTSVASNFVALMSGSSRARNRWSWPIVTLWLFVALMSGCSGAVRNPFDLVESEFLSVLTSIFLFAFFLGGILQWRFCEPNPQPNHEVPTLDWISTAYLSGGAARITDAAIAYLIGSGMARVSEDRKSIEAIPFTALPEEIDSVEKEVWAALPLSRDDEKSRNLLTRRIEAHSVERINALCEEGCLIKEGDRFAPGLVCMLPFAIALLFLAIPRLVMDLYAGKPVGYLVLVIAISTTYGFNTMIPRIHSLSHRGLQVLGQLKAHHQEAVLSDPMILAMVVALHGTAFLSRIDDESLKTLGSWYPQETIVAGCGCG